VFIRPKILRDADATETTSELQYNDLRQQQKSLNKGHITLLPVKNSPSCRPCRRGRDCLRRRRPAPMPRSNAQRAAAAIGTAPIDAAAAATILSPPDDSAPQPAPSPPKP